HEEQFEQNFLHRWLAPISYELRVDTLNNSPPGNADKPASAKSAPSIRSNWLLAAQPMPTVGVRPDVGLNKRATRIGIPYWSPIPGWQMRDQAAACERRSHSSKPMRPRRASPNGTSERSSTRPPKYRASGSLTTLRGSPIPFR